MFKHFLCLFYYLHPLAYDNSGQLVDELLTKGFNNRINIDDVVQLVYLNGEVIISSKDSKKLILIQNLKSSTLS